MHHHRHRHRHSSSSSSSSSLKLLALVPHHHHVIGVANQHQGISVGLHVHSRPSLQQRHGDTTCHQSGCNFRHGSCCSNQQSDVGRTSGDFAEHVSHGQRPICHCVELRRRSVGQLGTRSQVCFAQNMFWWHLFSLHVHIHRETHDFLTFIFMQCILVCSLCD